MTSVLWCCLLLSGCAANRAASTSAPAKHATSVHQPKLAQEPLMATEELAAELDLKHLRFVGMDDGPVPEFRLRAVTGHWFDSHDLVGEEPFIVVFFASWCAVCDRKLPMLRQALQATGPVTTIGVAVDDAQTFPRVLPFLNRVGMADLPVVAGTRFPNFTASYNPFSTVPLVVVVGQNGGLVDYQLGYAPNDEERLEAALRLAKSIGPLKASN